MDNQDPKNSVHDEQFGKNAENKDKKTDLKPSPEKQEKLDSESGPPEQKLKTDEDSSGDVHEVTSNGESSDASETEPATQDKATVKKESKSKKEKIKAEDESADSKPGINPPDDSSQKAPEKEVIQYALLSKKDLIKVLDDLLTTPSNVEISREVEEIKISFYKKHKEEIQKLKAKFLSHGGIETDFSPGYNEEEDEFKALLARYRDLRQAQLKVQEEEKEENLKKKYEIIKEIEDLIHTDESINKTFQEFRDLQRKWHDVGVVPQKDLKPMWETYHYNVEKFYDFIKINKELRDLDLRKNLELKTDLCEKAEALLLDPNIIQAFKTLQKYHEQWREIGPVPKEQRTDVWERFREATGKINKKHQLYYLELKDQQKKNLESKSLLCEKAEDILNSEINEHGDWVNKTREILELQKVWKTIGFAPKKDNNRIYARFRSACDKFFENKRAFYAQNFEDQSENLQKKIELCIQAERLKESTDWKQTSDDLIQLQRKWKNIGPVPRKKSEEVWRRFRAACDHFFNNRSKYFANIDSVYLENLNSKEKLVKEIHAFKPGDDQKENIKILNEFQKRWAEIGFVPIAKKDEISQKYRDAIDAGFDSLNMDDNKKNMLKFRTRVEGILKNSRSDGKLRFEREKLMNKLQQLKSDISVWENNIGFFASTKKADSMISDFENKIKLAHEKIKLLEDKISHIDDVAPDL